MKKLALGLLSLFLVVGTLSAQEGKKALKKGSKMLEKYSQNAVANADQLSEGLMLVKKAFEDAEVGQDAENINTQAMAYNGVASGQINAKILDGEFKITNGDLALKALDLFKKAYAMTDDKGDRKDAIAGIQATEGHLNNIGIYYFQVNDYGNAFDYFNAAIKAYEALKEMEGTSRLDVEVDRKDHYFYTGAAGFYGKKGAAAIPVLETLEREGTDKALVYEALYSLYSESDKAKGVAYLEKGREMFPDDTGLLFAEINYYLLEGKLEALTGKLKMAVEKEPDNVTIYNTLGNVFEQLSQGERESGNDEKSEEYFGEALKYYTEAVTRDTSNFDAVYSQGALYYNKAASLTDKINDLANDFSAAGTKKYDALKAKMDGYFDQAMPFFKKAISINANDLNTLIALKEIHARRNEMEKVGEYKARIEAIQAGGE